MRAAEEAAFANGVEVEALMDQAGAGSGPGGYEILLRSREVHCLCRERP